MSSVTWTPREGRDDDVIEGRVSPLDTCKCGHTREQHWAETGALGSFGGSACGECWACGTFRKKNV